MSDISSPITKINLSLKKRVNYCRYCDYYDPSTGWCFFCVYGFLFGLGELRAANEQAN